jgi:hypothetical protein
MLTWLRENVVSLLSLQVSCYKAKGKRQKTKDKTF